jgi:hypothetical protein
MLPGTASAFGAGVRMVLKGCGGGHATLRMMRSRGAVAAAACMAARSAARLNSLPQMPRLHHTHTHTYTHTHTHTNTQSSGHGYFHRLRRRLSPKPARSAAPLNSRTEMSAAETGVKMNGEPDMRTTLGKLLEKMKKAKVLKHASHAHTHYYIYNLSDVPARVASEASNAHSPQVLLYMCRGTFQCPRTTPSLPPSVPPSFLSLSLSLYLYARAHTHTHTHTSLCVKSVTKHSTARFNKMVHSYCSVSRLIFEHTSRWTTPDSSSCSGSPRCRSAARGTLDCDSPACNEWANRCKRTT